jgi:hypothetical protein
MVMTLSLTVQAKNSALVEESRQLLERWQQLEEKEQGIARKEMEFEARIAQIEANEKLRANRIAEVGCLECVVST